MNYPEITIDFDILPANKVGQCHLCEGVISADYLVYVTAITIKNQVTTFRFCLSHFDYFAAILDTFLAGYAYGKQLREEMSK